MTAIGDFAVVGGALLLSRAARVQSLEAMAIDAAIRRGCSPAILLAICDTEHGSTAWNPTAVNQGPGDAARGGAFGCAQMTLQTALGIAVPELQARWREITIAKRLAPPERSPAALLDPWLNLNLAAALCSTLQGRAITDGASPATLPDEVASRYNSGDPVSGAPQSTRTVYLPRFRKMYAARAVGST